MSECAREKETPPVTGKTEHLCMYRQWTEFIKKGSSESFAAYLQAQKLNKEIFETIYYHALRTSADLAAEEGIYETYAGCPISKVFTASCFQNFSSLFAVEAIYLRKHFLHFIFL